MEISLLDFKSSVLHFDYVHLKVKEWTRVGHTREWTSRTYDFSISPFEYGRQTEGTEFVYPKTSIMKVSSFSTNLRTNVLNTSKMKDGSFPFTGMALTVIEFSHEFFFRKSRKVQL